MTCAATDAHHQHDFNASKCNASKCNSNAADTRSSPPISSLHYLANSASAEDAPIVTHETACYIMREARAAQGAKTMQ